MNHVPVLLNEVLQCLNPRPGENFIDATLGDGGHALAILERNAPNGRVLGIDASHKAIKIVQERAKNKDFDKRIILVHDNFSNLQNIVADYQFNPIQGILADLGFSSRQIEESGRGFSFSKDEPLIMAYNDLLVFPELKRSEQIAENQTAAEIVNGWSEDDLTDIFSKYGEEKFSRQISRKIVESRKVKPIITTFQLVEIIKEATPFWYHHRHSPKRRTSGALRGRHPATKIFQALRIAVNDELRNLERFLPQALEILDRGGRLAIISFHSLEDRIVKNFIRDSSRKNLLKIINKKVIRPGREEIKINPRARSAKLRSAIKL